MSKKLSATEQVKMIQQIFSLLKLFTEEEALAGIILTPSSYYQIRTELALHVQPYKPAEIDLDPGCENSFVVNGVLFLKGTQLQ